MSQCLNHTLHMYILVRYQYGALKRTQLRHKQTFRRLITFC